MSDLCEAAQIGNNIINESRLVLSNSTLCAPKRQQQKGIIQLGRAFCRSEAHASDYAQRAKDSSTHCSDFGGSGGSRVIDHTHLCACGSVVVQDV